MEFIHIVVKKNDFLRIIIEKLWAMLETLLGGNIPGIFLEYPKSGLKYCSNIPEILLKYCRNIPMSEKNVFERKSAIFLENFRNIPATFLKCFRNVSGIFQEYFIQKFYHRNQIFKKYFNEKCYKKSTINFQIKSIS